MTDIKVPVSGIGTVTIKVYIDGVLKPTGTKNLDLNSANSLLQIP